jgi:hypothetical protein
LLFHAKPQHQALWICPVPSDVGHRSATKRKANASLFPVLGALFSCPSGDPPIVGNTSGAAALTACACGRQHLPVMGTTLSRVESDRAGDAQ